jgi:hypothetical protein
MIRRGGTSGGGVTFLAAPYISEAHILTRYKISAFYAKKCRCFHYLSDQALVACNINNVGKKSTVLPTISPRILILRADRLLGFVQLS